MTHQVEPENLRKACIEAHSKTMLYTDSSISVPCWLHKFIFGEKGHNISKTTQSLLKVHIEFTSGDKITIEGPTKDMYYAQEQIEAIVDYLINRMDYAEVIVDYKFYKHLIRNNGAIINRKDRNKVSVVISHENEKNNLIRIEGESQDVQQAKREILELASDFKNEHTKDLVIEQRYHQAVIGWGGEQIQDIRKKFPEVIIDFPDPAQKSDIIHLRGPKYELEKCTQYLDNLVRDIVESNFSITIPIFKMLHKNIIGRGDANIKKICSANNTKIQVPSASSSSENIVISGKPADCEIACDWIRSIQKSITNFSEVEISIPSNLHESLTDSKDCLIGSIMEECRKIHIHFPKDNSGLQRVIIRGPAQNVERAKKKLLQLAEEKETKNYALILHAKSQCHKFLMNKNGGDIPKICEETGACIIFPVPGDKDNDLLTIIGSEKSVKDAQKELEALITNLDNVVEDNILINPMYHHHLFM